MSTDVNVDLYFCSQCLNFSWWVVYLLHIRHGSANLLLTQNTFLGGNYIVCYTVWFLCSRFCYMHIFIASLFWTLPVVQVCYLFLAHSCYFTDLNSSIFVSCRPLHVTAWLRTEPQTWAGAQSTEVLQSLVRYLCSFVVLYIIASVYSYQ